MDNRPHKEMQMDTAVEVAGVQPAQPAETAGTSSRENGEKNYNNTRFSYEVISELSNRIKAHDTRIGELNRKIEESEATISKGFNWRPLAAGDTRRRTREKVLLTPTAVRDLRVKIGKLKVELAEAISERRLIVNMHRLEAAAATRRLRREWWIVEFTHRAEEDPENFLAFLVGKLNRQTGEVKSDLEAIRTKRVTDAEAAGRDLMKVLVKVLYGAHAVLKRRPSMKKEFFEKFFGETATTR